MTTKIVYLSGKYFLLKDCYSVISTYQVFIYACMLVPVSRWKVLFSSEDLQDVELFQNSFHLDYENQLLKEKEIQKLEKKFKPIFRNSLP